MRKVAIVALTVIVGAAILAPVIAPFDPALQLNIASLKNSAPSWSHPLGTDAYSRDLLSRLLFGTRTSLLVGFLATAVAIALGCVWGGVAAIVAPRIGNTMMMVVDVMRSVPRMLLFLVAVALLGAMSSVLLALILGVAAWPVIARLTYSFTRDVTQRDFVEAARAVGLSQWRILVRYVAPHTSGALTAAGALLLADVLAAEAGLSFLGIGIRPPNASWGNMVQDAVPYLASAWWVAAIPCTCLLVTVLAVSNLADALHENEIRTPASRSR